MDGGIHLEKIATSGCIDCWVWSCTLVLKGLLVFSKPITDCNKISTNVYWVAFCQNKNRGFYSFAATFMDTTEWYFQNYHYWSHFWMYFCRRSGLLKNSKQQQIEIKRIFCFYRMMTRVGKDDMGGKEEKSCSEEMISFSVLFWQGHNKHTMFFCYRY